MHDYAVQRHTLSGGNEIPVRTGRDQPDSTVHGVFTAPDGYLVIAARADDAWQRLARLIDGEALGDPQTIGRGMVVEPAHPMLGRIKLPDLPFRFCDCDTSPRGPAPLMGQHNRDIATSLGYAAGDFDTLVRDGVLYAEQTVTAPPRPVVETMS